jgi:hypothetical protein
MRYLLSLLLIATMLISPASAGSDAAAIVSFPDNVKAILRRGDDLSARRGAG